MAAETYEDLIYRLGDIAYERLWNKPNAPRMVARVIKAAETYEQRQIELRELEGAMDAEEAAYNEFREACETESAQCHELVEKHKRAVGVAEAKAKSLEAKLVTKRKDVSVGRVAVQKSEDSIRQLEGDGEVDKARAARENLKKTKIDLMKRVRECEDMQAEYDQIMNPQTGPGAEGIRARRREKDLELQLEERTEAYNALITDLNDQAATKDQEVKAAQEYYEQALLLLGEEVYAARVPDPALASFYPKLDKLKG